jgi:hypothetical protein
MDDQTQTQTQTLVLTDLCWIYESEDELDIQVPSEEIGSPDPPTALVSESLLTFLTSNTKDLKAFMFCSGSEQFTGLTWSFGRSEDEPVSSSVSLELDGGCISNLEQTIESSSYFFPLKNDEDLGHLLISHFFRGKKFIFPRACPGDDQYLFLYADGGLWCFWKHSKTVDSWEGALSLLGTCSKVDVTISNRRFCALADWWKQFNQWYLK